MRKPSIIPQWHKGGWRRYQRRRKALQGKVFMAITETLWKNISAKPMGKMWDQLKGR